VSLWIADSKSSPDVCAFELAYLIFWARAHTSHPSRYFSVKPTLRDRNARALPVAS